MYLYNYNKNNLDVYRLTAGDKKLRNFKDKELTNFIKAGNTLVYNFKNYHSTEVYESFRGSNSMSYESLEDRKNYRNWSELNADQYYTDFIKQLYIEGKLHDKSLAKVIEENGQIKYYFMEVEKLMIGDKERYLNNFLNLPESLYYLEMFERRRFDKVFSEATPEIIEKILSMYVLAKDYTWTTSQLHLLEQEGLLKDFKEIENTMYYGGEILKRVRTLK